MHEQALMRDLMTRILGIADSEGATAVTKVSVRLGALSHFTPQHFREHFHDSSQGTIAEGALVEAVVEESTTDEKAQGVVLESVELEEPD